MFIIEETLYSSRKADLHQLNILLRDMQIYRSTLDILRYSENFLKQEVNNLKNLERESRKGYHDFPRLGCVLPNLPYEIIGIILAYVPTKRILHHRPRTIFKQPSYYFPPAFHLRADSFPHSDLQRLLDLKFRLHIHLQIGSEDETIYKWESIANIRALCENLGHSPGLSSCSLSIKHLSIFVQREVQLLRLLEPLKWALFSVDKLQMRLFYPSKKASGRLKQVLNDSIGFEPKEVTVCCHLFVSLGRITPFRLVKNLTLEDNCEDFQTLLQLMASSMPVLSYLDVYGIKLNESDGPRLPLEAGEIGVNMESLRRVAFALKPAF